MSTLEARHHDPASRLTTEQMLAENAQDSFSAGGLTQKQMLSLKAQEHGAVSGVSIEGVAGDEGLTAKEKREQETTQALQRAFATNDIHQMIADIDFRIEEIDGEISHLRTALNQIEIQRGHLGEQRDVLVDKEKELQQDITKQTEQAQAAEEEMRLAEEELEAARLAEERLQRDALRATNPEQAERIQRDLEAQGKIVNEAEQAYQDKLESFMNETTSLEQLQKHLQDTQSGIADIDAKLAELDGEEASIKAQIKGLESQRETLVQTRDELTAMTQDEELVAKLQNGEITNGELFSRLSSDLQTKLMPMVKDMITSSMESVKNAVGSAAEVAANVAGAVTNGIGGVVTGIAGYMAGDNVQFEDKVPPKTAGVKTEIPDTNANFGDAVAGKAPVTNRPAPALQPTEQAMTLG